ncbi:MAG TPA: succinyl-CoA synthetase subunit beta, partial [Methanoregulaceae archaeon]|nr:succinyl-CoA synthetase subunit beta [Methanoregulaceae archaeon]
MKFLEHEAKSVFSDNGIPVPRGFLIHSADELAGNLEQLPPEFVLKAQVDVGGRGKAGGILMADRKNGVENAKALFGKSIKGVAVKEILAEERLEIQHEYYASIAVDRSTKEALILFTEEGGVDIEILARERPSAIRRASIPLLMTEIPPFMLRDLLGEAPREAGRVLQSLYTAFCRKDAVLAEINPLVTTPAGL